MGAAGEGWPQRATPARWRIAWLSWLPLLLVAGSASALDPLAIDAPAGAAPIGPAYFGVHVHNLLLRQRPQDPPQPTPFPAADAGALRLWDSATRWAELEPAPQHWNFARLDAYIEAASRHGARIVLTLGSTPRWASARPDEPCSYGFGCAAEPADLALWDRYVAALARRYQGRIAWYEVWNEPHPGEHFGQRGGFYTGDLATLVELARRAKAVLAREDPAARLLTPGFVNRLPVLDRYLAEGGAAVADGVAYHLYARDDEQMVARVRTLRAIMARHGLSGRPLINTESSFVLHGDDPAADTPRGRQAAALQVRATILGAFLGIDGWFLHGWDHPLSGAVDRELRGTALLGPYRAVRGWLLGLTPEGCRSIGPDTVRCDGSKDGQRVALLWRYRPGAGEQTWRPDPGWALTAVQTTDGPVAPAASIGLTDMPVAVWLSPTP